jgi:hypothetical protein
MKDTGRLYGPSLLYIDGVWWFVIASKVLQHATYEGGL